MRDAKVKNNTTGSGGATVLAPRSLRLPIAACCALLFLGNASARDLPSIVASGYINIGVRLTPAVYSPQDDGSVDGFCWNLAIAFAKSIGVEPRPVVIRDGQEYWQNDDAQRPGSPPAVYDRIDIAADTFTFSDERYKIAYLVGVLNVSDIFVSRQGDEINKAGDLVGKAIVVSGAQNSNESLRRLLGENGIPYVENTFDIKKTPTGWDISFPKGRSWKPKTGVELLLFNGNYSGARTTVLYELLAESRFDAAMSTSITVLSFNLQIASMRKLFSLSPVQGSAVNTIYFAIPFSAPDLKTKFEGFVVDAGKDGTMDSVLRRTTGLGQTEYGALLRQK